MPSPEQQESLVKAMLRYLDKQGLLVDLEEVQRRRDGKQAWKIRLFGSDEFYGSTRSAFDYLSGACNATAYLRNTTNPRTGQ